jgi:hypothetical protein
MNGTNLLGVLPPMLRVSVSKVSAANWEMPAMEEIVAGWRGL